jgi:hypothetical protein
MSDIQPLGFTPEIDEEDNEPALETPSDMRPDLTALGLQEHERGVVEDTYENRQLLRAAHYTWDPVYSQSGSPTGLIAARSPEQNKERRLLSLTQKKPLLEDPSNNNSNYITGLDLLIDDEATKITPPWVIGATKTYIKEQESGGPKTDRRAPAALPHRCRMMKSDGIRCMLWSSGRLKDDGLCRIHLRSIRKPGEDVERARRKLMQAAPYAVDVLEELMESAHREDVKLKASTEILDRAGVRGGMELDVGVEVMDRRPAHMIVAERLQRLAAGAAALQNGFMSTGHDGEVEDAEVVETEEVTAEEMEIE